jgi:hypothetical protein
MADLKTRRIAELLGLLGVIASIIFVGVEIRQNSVATRAATDAAVSDAFRELNLVLASSPDLAAAFAAAADNPAGAPSEAQTMMLSFYRALFHIWSNGHRQHLNGTIDPAIFRAIVQEISTYAGDAYSDAEIDDIDRRRRLTRWAWDSERFIFNSDFQVLVDSILASEP